MQIPARTPTVKNPPEQFTGDVWLDSIDLLYQHRVDLETPIEDVAELGCAVSVCSPDSPALGGCEPQLKGHTAANLRVGNDRATLLAALTHLVPFIGYPRTLNGLRVLDEVAPAEATAAQS